MNVHDRKVKSGERLDVQDRVGDSDPQVTRLDIPASDRLGDGDVAHALSSERTTKTSWGRLLLKGVVPLLVVAAGYGAYSYLKATKPTALKQAKTERAFAVSSIVIKPGTYQPSLKLFGTTVSGRRMDIRALVSGRVVSTNGQLREGGEVSKGEVLLTVDPFDYERSLVIARAQLTEAQARRREFEASRDTDEMSLKYAREQSALSQKDLERAKPLAGRGAVSYRTVDERQQTALTRRQGVDLLVNNIKVWSARIAQQEATIARLQASVDVAQRSVDETKLMIPFNAFVSDVSSHSGRMVSANDSIAVLSDRDWIEARFTMTDEQFGRIVSTEKSLKGRSVVVDWVLGGTTLSYKATVERIGAKVSSSTGGIEVFARLDAPADPVAIRPGAFVEVLVPDAKFEDVFRLPSNSLYFGDTVFVIVKKRLVARKVRVVGGDGDELLLRGDLKAGERVLKTRVSTPGDGVLVEEVDAS